MKKIRCGRFFFFKHCGNKRADYGMDFEVSLALKGGIYQIA